MSAKFIPVVLLLALASACQDQPQCPVGFFVSRPAPCEAYCHLMTDDVCKSPDCSIQAFRILRPDHSASEGVVLDSAQKNVWRVLPIKRTGTWSANGSNVTLLLGGDAAIAGTCSAKGTLLTHTGGVWSVPTKSVLVAAQRSIR